MTDSEIVQLRAYGFTQKEIVNLRKVVRSIQYLTSDTGTVKNVFELNLPEESRFFFGLRSHCPSKAAFDFNFKLNDELIVETGNTSLFNSEKKSNSVREEYVELSRRLHGNDAAIISFFSNFTAVQVFTYIYAVDVTVQPKEGK